MILRIVLIMSLITSPAAAEIITIMAANTTSGSSQAYEGPGIRIFQGLQPDVVLVQEFNYNSGSLRDLVDLALGTEYEYYVEGGSENIPNGIISRFPIISSGEWFDNQVPDRDFAWAIIDIPGDLNLQVVSVHLKSGESSTQETQALAIKSYVASNFNAAHYIVVAGDMNTTSRYAPAIAVFDTFLDPYGHTPADQEGRSATSEPRTKPYDWVIPNDLLDDCHVPLDIESSTYLNGLVFDSEVYTPLSEVYPVQFGDSHVDQMQHMAVMRAFDVGALTSPTPTFTPVFTPTPTPTQPGTGPTVDLILNKNFFLPGDLFQLRFTIENDSEARDSVQFIVLDVYGSYFFHPGWTSELAWTEIQLIPHETRDTDILEFNWPENTGSATDLWFYAALATPDGFDLVSNLASADFSYAD